MTSEINANGLTVDSINTLIDNLTTGMQSIYGADINVDQNSPDGQLINLFAQAIADMLELAVQINNGFDPDRAVGRILDERVVINNITRRGGTFTIQPVNITVDRTVDLQGLDADANNVNGTGYTVQDDAGNQFILIDSDTLTAGTHSLNFRAQQLGQVETTVNTIVNPVTIVLGVTAINNPSGALEVGQNEETDAELRVRRQQSVAIASTGYLNGLLAAVLNLTGVTDASLYENVTDAVDGDGIPAHGIWLIAEGGANTDIGNAIYTKKSYGANMKGAVEVDITTASGDIFVAKFDRPTPADLYIRFDIQPTAAGAIFDQAAIKQYLVDNLSYKIGQFAETSNITLTALLAITANGGQGVPLNVEISDDGLAWDDYLPTATKDAQWTVDTTRITITVLP